MTDRERLIELKINFVENFDLLDKEIDKKANTKEESKSEENIVENYFHPQFRMAVGPEGH